MSSVTSRLAALVSPEATSVGYLLAMSRPRFWLYLAGPTMVGVVYGAGTRAELFAPLTIALTLYFLVPANVFLYGVNDVFDATVDAENPKKDEREVRYRGSRTVVAAVVVSAVLAVPFALALPAPGVVALAGFLFLGAEYSAPPLRFKTTPLLDSVSNGLYLLPGIAGYAAVTGTYPPALAIVGGWLWTMAMHTFSAIPDIDPDRAAGIRTTATVLGERRTYLYCGVIWTVAAVAFGLVHPFFGVVLAIYPPFVATIAVSDVAVDRAYWWFPYLNGLVGMCMTLGGLWRLLYGA